MWQIKGVKIVLVSVFFSLLIVIEATSTLADSKLKILTFEGHPGGVTGIAVTPDGHQVVSGGRDKTVKLWDITTGALFRTFEGHAGQVDCVSVTRHSAPKVDNAWDNLPPMNGRTCQGAT